RLCIRPARRGRFLSDRAAAAAGKSRDFRAHARLPAVDGGRTAFHQSAGDGVPVSHPAATRLGAGGCVQRWDAGGFSADGRQTAGAVPDVSSLRAGIHSAVGFQSAFSRLLFTREPNQRVGEHLDAATMTTPVPPLNLAANFHELGPELLAEIRQVCESGYYVLGPKVAAFEEALASYCGSKYAIGMSSGTDALLAALMALDIGPGDEVICPTFTFFGTAGVVSRLGATPVFCDI